MDPDHQIHDFNPGLDNGLFWTVVIPGRDVFVDLPNERAHLEVHDIDLEDYHDVVNALMDGPSKPATASFRVRWHHLVRRRHVRDDENRFDLHAIQTRATVEWKAERKGIRFVSDNSATKLEFAEIGRERNGRYF